MPVEFDYEFLQSITWYAIDLDGKVGAFDSGQMAQAAERFVMDWRRVDELVCALPESSEHCMLRSKDQYWDGVRPVTRLSDENMKHIQELMWPTFERTISELPRRGIFQFEATRVPYGVLPPTYNLECLPASPISATDLPPEALRIIKEVVAPVRFNETRFTDIREWSNDR